MEDNDAARIISQLVLQTMAISQLVQTRVIFAFAGGWMGLHLQSIVLDTFSRVQNKALQAGRTHGIIFIGSNSFKNQMEIQVTFWI